MNGQCQMGGVAYEGTLSSSQPNYKKKSVLELRRNLSKDAYATTVYLSEMNFIITTQNFLRNSVKLR